MAPHSRSVIPVWIATAVAAVAVAVLVPADGLTWLPIVMVAAVLLTFVIQLAVSRQVGFVERIMASVGGALVILVITTAALWAVGAFAGPPVPCGCV